MGIAVLTSKFEGFIYLFNFMELMPLHFNSRKKKKKRVRGDMIKFVAKAIHCRFSL